MIAVYYDANCLFVDGVRTPMPAGSLVAVATGNVVSIQSLHATDPIAMATFDTFCDQDGSGFADAAACVAYLSSQFILRRPVGDQVAFQVAVLAEGQTAFPLEVAPTSPLTVRLLVNGAEFRAPDILVSSTRVVWQNPDFVLEPSDDVYIVYA